MTIAISLSAYVMLVCLFGPKLYIIIFHPERNIRQSMMAPSQRHANVSMATGQVKLEMGGIKGDDLVGKNVNGLDKLVVVDNWTSMEGELRLFFLTDSLTEFVIKFDRTHHHNNHTHSDTIGQTENSNSPRLQPNDANGRLLDSFRGKFVR